MKFKFLITCSLLFIASCNSPASKQIVAKKSLNTDSMKTVLMNNDLAFSELSSQKGTHEAFLAYVADEGALLRPYHQPIAGKDSVRAYLLARPDTAFSLTWQPLFADISASGDLGYTYGTYKLTIKKLKESEAGTYVSIWRQDATGNWKFVLDTGNPGLQPEQQLKN